MDIVIQNDQPVIVGPPLNDSDINDGYQNVATIAGVITTENVTATNRNVIKNNNENTPPKNVDCYIKRPKTCSLLDVSTTSAEMSVNFGK